MGCFQVMLLFLLVMAGLVPAIHDFDLGEKDVDARHEAGHDDDYC